MTPLVSIVILNWNGKEHIDECLSSVLASNYPNFEVIVVDNASTDGSVDIIKQKKRVILIQNKCNTGFAAGNNIGFSAAKGKYIVTLNNDTCVASDWLNEPVRRFENDEKTGIISCRQMDYYKRDIINGLYHYPDETLLFRARGFGKNWTMSMKSGFVISANGASSIFRKEMLDSIGGFDERFFAYHEYCDIGMRAFLAGWNCLYVPVAVIYHKEGASFKKKNNTFNYYFHRNRFWFLYKFFPVSSLLRHSFQIFFGNYELPELKFLKNESESNIFAQLKTPSRFSMFKSERKRNTVLFAKETEFNKFLNEKFC